jgi:hypothetical protein
MCRVACDRNESRKIRTSKRRTAVMARSVSRSHDNINADNKYGVLGRHTCATPFAARRLAQLLSAGSVIIR